MWIIAEFEPTALFSLRPVTATTSGGKSLIVPTPFAVKMALLDVAIRTQGVEAGQFLFPQISRLRIAVRLPSQIVVNSTFTRILRRKEIKTKASEKASAIAGAIAERQWPYYKTIAYREYVQLAGPFLLAFEGMASESLVPLIVQVNYLGKRGGFLQLRKVPVDQATLPDDFTEITAGLGDAFQFGILQVLDDFGPTMKFSHANIYDEQGIRLGNERILRHVVLPYRLDRTSRGFSLYRRLD